MPHFTTSDGVSLHYTVSGQGTPILALAGLTRNGSDFDYVAPHLSDNQLITLDYRGRGASDYAPQSTYTIPIEARDALELLDHLEIDKTAMLGTSRGGLIAMLIAATAKHRLTGVALNDIGPEIDTQGMDAIMTYIGRNPAQKTYAEAATLRENLMQGFENVPQSRWDQEVRKHYIETPIGLRINYDPMLRDAVIAARAQPVPDLWPLFDTLATLPLCVLRGANSNLLSADTFAKMQSRHGPEIIAVQVPDRGHVPFLDEPQALSALTQWTKMFS